MRKGFSFVRYLLAVGWAPLALAGDLPEEADWRDTLVRLVERNDGFGGGVARVAQASGGARVAVFGGLDGTESTPMTDETPFEVASVTKAVTATTVMRLVERGVLDLNATLKDVLTPSLIRGWDSEITIRQLLSHTSGLPDYWTDGRKDREGRNAFLRAFLAERSREWMPVDVLAFARGMPAKPPGGRFHYSDTNFVLLGLVVEQATGRPLHEVFRQEVFEPLGMSVTWMSFRERARRRPAAHRFEGREDLTVTLRQTADWAGGGLVSTAEDLEKFLRGLFSGKLISRESLAEMCRWVPTGEKGIFYGLGLYRVVLDGGRGEWIGHDGHGNAFAYFSPQRGITLTGTLNQVENDWWPLAEVVVGEKDAVSVETPKGTLEGSLSAGWDSLYLYRGVNVLGGGGYGAGIQTTALVLTLAAPGPVSPVVELAQGFSTGSSDYSETSITVQGDFSWEEFELSCGYNVSLGSADGFFQSHELFGRLGRPWELGSVTVTPSFEGVLGLGPETIDGGGGGRAGCGYLAARIDAVCFPRDWLALGVWTEAAVNLGYNSRVIDGDDLEAFNGWNHVLSGVSLTLWPGGRFSASAYGAWSHALADFSSTRADTFVGGGQVTVGF